jgi:hypothetical protein
MLSARLYACKSPLIGSIIKAAVYGMAFALLFCTGRAQTASVDTGASAKSQAIPAFEIIGADAEEPLRMTVSDDLHPKPAFEIPPVLVTGSQHLFLATTAWSVLCRDDGDPLDGHPLRLDHRHCQPLSGPLRIDMASGQNLSPSAAAGASQDWRRSYDGVMSAFLLPQNGGRSILLAIAHGENKNERIGNEVFANTVDTNVDPQKCASGYTNGHYEDCWASYNGFVNALSVTIDRENLPGLNKIHDIGPMIWPSMGYSEGGKKVSAGVRHPNAIIAGGDLFIFYTDTSRGSEDGRQGGVHVARVSLCPSETSERLIAIPFYEGTFSGTNPSLPVGFDRNRIHAFFDKKGGRASELWPMSTQAIKFSVARIRNTPFFIGAEEYIAGKIWGIRLRISPDLLHWSNPVAVPGEVSNEGWANGSLHYPVFCDASGKMESEIDADNFFLLGSRSSGGVVVRKRLAIEIQ